MRGATWKPLPIVAGLLLVLTYLSVKGANPDPVLHERTLHTLHALVLDDAALHRDALKARANLLPNYDPLVRAADGLRGAVDALRIAGEAAHGETGAVIGPHLRELAATVAEQEALVETFKSDNALLQNSLTYFMHASHDLGLLTGDRRQDVAAEVGVLANAMLRFMHEPQSGAAGKVTTSLDRLARLPAAQQPLEADISTLVAHGRLIVAMLPKVDGTLGRLLAVPTAKWVQALQEGYLDHFGRVTARAKVFRVLLYLASLALLAYLSLLFVRLRTSARTLAERSSTLQARLDFESLIAGISAQFINLPPNRVDDGIKHALGRLGEHVAVDRAYILRSDAGGTCVDDTLAWCRAGIHVPIDGLGSLPVAASSWKLEHLERHGGIHVPRVDTLPATPELSSLRKRGIRSWLCLPIGYTGKRVDFLAFDTVREEKRWSADDIALLRTAGEILANALERKRAEVVREMLEGRQRQSQRLEAIGSFAGSVAHDFNNILGAVLGHSEMALAVAEDGRTRHHLRQVMTAGERAQGVVEQILAFSRRSEHECRPIWVQPLVEEAVDQLRASLAATATIRTELAAEQAMVLGDTTRFHQVVMNLCTNAAQAMQGYGTLVVALDMVEVAGDLALSHGVLRAGRYVRLTVSDTGCGMDGVTMERIFDPFFTTKAVSGGTGLGLSTVHGVVADHGGAMNVRSRPGQGSTFEAYFAQAERSALGDHEEVGVPIPRGRGETILLVDDERSLVLLGEEMLAELGYDPVGFASAAQALAAFRADPRRFDLVLTDMVMPEMTGTELAAALHELQPELPIILMTGYSGSVRSRQLHAASIREILKKPLRSRDMAESITRHLHPSGPLEKPVAGLAPA